MEKIKVIIADDNEEICRMIKNKLEQYDEIKVLAICHSDHDELNLIKDLKPDVVITDIIRNGIESELEIIKTIKNMEKSPKILVISAVDYNVKFTKIVDGFIKKPIMDMGMVIKNIKILCEKHI